MRVKIMQFRTWAIAATMLGLAHTGSVAAHAEEARRPNVPHQAARALVGNTLVYAKPDRAGEETALTGDATGGGGPTKPRGS